MKQESNKKVEHSPWYKEFWVWVIIGLPASVVIGCLFTVYIAFHYADSVVDDDWSKHGLTINEQIESEMYAKQIGLKASIDISRNTGEILISLNQQPSLKTAKNDIELDNSKILTLRLEHPTMVELDQKIILYKKSAGNYKGEIKQFYSGERYLSLVPQKGLWKLKGKIKLFTNNQQIIIND